MKKLAIVLIALVAAYFGYRHFASSARLETTYRKFAEEVLRRHYDAAAAMTDGLTAADLEKLGSQEHIGAGPPMFQKLFPSHFAVNSREDAADGSVVLHATQTVLFNPAGVESVLRPAMYATLKQVVTLHKSGGEWKVTAFENKFESMDTFSVR